MDKNNYTKAEDFILDDSFSHYVLNREDPNNTWETFVKENPELSSEINTARKLIKYLNSAQKLPIQVNKQEELTRLLHTINQPVKRFSLARSFFKYAAAIILLFSSFYLLKIHEHVLYKEYYAKNVNTVISLTDGTNINLRTGSSLQVSRFYEKHNRNVKLDGEAFFDVHRNEKMKFVIQLSKSKVIVLGTSFNINSNTDSSLVTVREGKVLFQSDKTSTEILLAKNMSASCNTAGNIKAREFNLNEMGWSTGEFYFSNLSFSLILKQLETYYGVDFQLNKRYKNKILSFHVSNMELDEVLSLLEQIVPEIELERENTTVSIN